MGSFGEMVMRGTYCAVFIVSNDAIKMPLGDVISVPALDGISLYLTATSSVAPGDFRPVLKY